MSNTGGRLDPSVFMAREVSRPHGDLLERMTVTVVTQDDDADPMARAHLAFHVLKG